MSKFLTFISKTWIISQKIWNIIQPILHIKRFAWNKIQTTHEKKQYFGTWFFQAILALKIKKTQLLIYVKLELKCKSWIIILILEFKFILHLKKIHQLGKNLKIIFQAKYEKYFMLHSNFFSKFFRIKFKFSWLKIQVLRLNNFTYMFYSYMNTTYNRILQVHWQ